MSIWSWSLSKYPNYSDKFIVNQSFWKDYYVVIVTNQLLYLRIRNHSIFFHEFGRGGDIPLKLIYHVLISGNYFQVIIKSDSVDSKPCNVHFEFKKWSNGKIVVSIPYNFVNSSIVSQKINVAELYLIISNWQVRLFDKCVINNIQDLWVHWAP